MDVVTILAAKGSHVETVRPDRTVLHAAQVMRAMGIGALVVSADGIRAEGLLAERDIVLALAERPESILTRRVGDVMTKEFVSAQPDESITDIMAKMTRFRQRHVPVVDRGRLVGIVSIGDLVQHRIAEVELQSAVAADLLIINR